MVSPHVLARSPHGTQLPLGNLGGHVGPVPVLLRHLCHGRPAKDHYLPDLHHMRLELEEAATPEGHAVRFGFNPLEFENFSWRGYAHMMAIQVDHAAPSLGLVQRWGALQWPAEQAAPRDQGTQVSGQGNDVFSYIHHSPGSWPG